MGASNQKHTKNLEKAQGKSMDPESSDSDLINQFGGHFEKKMEELAEKYFKKVADSMSREISSLKQKIDGIDVVIARLESEKTNLLNETKQKISDLEKQVEDKAEEIKGLESDKNNLLKELKENEQNSNLKEQVEDKDKKIARLEREKNYLLHEKTKNESTIKENQLKIDTLMQEKKTWEMELQKKEKELQEEKKRAEIELEKVRKEKEKELQEDKIKAEIELEKVRKELSTEKGLHLQSKCQANIDKAALKKEIAEYKK